MKRVERVQWIGVIVIGLAHCISRQATTVEWKRLFLRF